MSDALTTDGLAQAQPLPSPVVDPLADNDKLVHLLCELLDKSDPWVRQHLHEEELCMGKHHREEFAQFGAPPHVWSDQLEAYYRQSRVGRISLVTWNRRPEKLQMRAWIGRHLAKSKRPLKVLVIGDGAGFDSLYLSQCGHDVTYSELSHWAIQFARLLFEHSGSSVRVVTNLQDIERVAYDVVVCLDVLEHVTDPPALVADIAGYLRDNGQLIVHAPFFFVSPMCPTHLESNRRFSGSLKLYREQGFVAVDGRPFWDPLVLVRATDPRAGNADVFRGCLLRLTGMLLATARIWNFPHNMMAHRALSRVDPRRLEGLRP